MEFRKAPLALFGCSLTFVTWYPVFGNVGKLGQSGSSKIQGGPFEGEFLSVDRRSSFF